MRNITRLLIWTMAAGLALPATAQQAAQPKPAKPAAKAAAGQARPVKSYRDIQYPPLNEVEVPEPVRFELPNGMIVYLVEDRELPMVRVSAMIRAGSRWEPIEKAGLASITGSVMRTGGTAARPGDRLDEELDRLGAIVETSVGEDSGRATVSVLKEDLGEALAILADLLQNPAFPEDKIELAKVQHRDAIARRNDDPQDIASREFQRLIYGKESPYSRQPEYETINAIKRDDLAAFHKQFFQPENVVLGAWGDFDPTEMRARITKAFESWQRGGRPKPPVPEVEPAAGNRAGVYLINKDDVNQSTVFLGFLGGKRNDPDYYALTVANTILGGGFASRLFSKVRSEEGLAYAVWSSWSAGWDRPGLFMASGGTKSETTLKIVNSIKREIAGIAAAQVGDEELARAKDAILKGFAFEFDSTGKIVGRMMTYEYFGYPRDYLQQYRANIEKVTKADVLRVAKQYLKADQLAVLVLGRESDFEQPLSTLGEVAAIDISIPQPKPEALGAATPEAAAKGKALLAAARDAMGGAALRGVKDYTTAANLVLLLPQGEIAMKMESTLNLSGKMLNKMATPMGEIVQGYDGETLWMKTPQGVQELPEAQRREVEGTFLHNTVSLLQRFEGSGVTVQALGPAEVEGRQVEAVAVSERDSQVKVYIDPQSNLLVKKTYTGSMMGTPGEIEEVFSDYRDAGGLKLPFKAVISQNGQKRAEQTVTDVRINPGVDDAAYQKP